MLAAAALAGACLGCSPRGHEAPKAAPLRVVMAPEVTGIDPDHQTAHGGFSVVSNVFEGLTSLDSEMRLAPGLAARWENPDELTWRFFLRPGVAFHDGRGLRAADVAWSLQRARRPGSPSQGALAVIRAVEAPSDGEVVLRTVRPNPMLLTALTWAFVTPEGSLGDEPVPVGTGPYRVVA